MTSPTQPGSTAPRPPSDPARTQRRPPGRLWAAFRLELATARSTYLYLLYPLVPAGIIGWLSRLPEITVMLFMVLTMFIGGQVFAVHERNHADQLFCSLPLRRADVVVARFLYALAVGLVALVVAALFAVVVDRAGSAGLSWFAGLAALTGGWLFYCLAVAVSYPIYFALGFSRAYVFTMLPFMVVTVVGVIVFRRGQTNGLQAVLDLSQWLQEHAVLMSVAGLTLGLALLVVSTLVACRLYRTKELG
ncbi:MAG: ABC-2 transporter permease [Propionibacteriaceae bacterium]|jgi:ABC-type transport system involved in multi-copper enzyme maturation permease subunit|nr:ABC-2 transporter permease [Propionibacteriaceae bacterium]